MNTRTAATHTAFVYASKVHLTMVDFKKRASCSQNIRYMGLASEPKTWNTEDQCKRCFKGYVAS